MDFGGVILVQMNVFSVEKCGKVLENVLVVFRAWITNAQLFNASQRARLAAVSFVVKNGVSMRNVYADLPKLQRAGTANV